VSSANAINATLYDKLNFNFIRDIARARRPKLRFQNISGLPQGPAGASRAS
jgi:hypothetical protein